MLARTPLKCLSSSDQREKLLWPIQWIRPDRRLGYEFSYSLYAPPFQLLQIIKVNLNMNLLLVSYSNMRINQEKRVEIR